MDIAYQTMGSTPQLSSTLNERAAMLAKTHWAGVYSDPELLTLASYLGAYKVPKGAFIIQEGAPASFMFLLVSGKVDILKKDSNKRDKVLASASPGMTLGEMALIDGLPRSATVLAKEDSLLLIMSKEKLQRLTQDSPSLALKLYGHVASQLSRRLRQLSGEMADYLL